MTKLITNPTDAPPITQKALREIIERIYLIEDGASSSATQQLAVNKGLAAGIESLSVTIAVLPITLTGFVREDGRGLSAGAWNMFANIEIPEGKNYVHIMTTVNAQFLDTTGGGLPVATAQIEHNIVSQSDLSPVVSAAKDAGVSAVNNVLNVAHVTGMQFTPGVAPHINATVYFGATNVAHYPNHVSDFATLNSLAIFSSV